MGDVPRSHRGEPVEIRDPVSGETRPGLLPPRLLEKAARSGRGAVLELAGPVRRLLRQPPCIFRGITRDTDDDRGQTEGWLCFTGRSSERYHYGTGSLTASAGRVLMVYVNKDWAVYHWRWEFADESAPDQPADMMNDDASPRFKEQFR